MKIYLFILSLLMIAFISGCVSINSLQSGRTIDKGNLEIAGSLTSGEFTPNSPSLKSAIDYVQYDYVPVFEATAKYGLYDNFDLALKLNTAGFVMGQVKYQFLGSKKTLFAGSVGADFGAFPVWTIFGVIDTYISVPLYISFHPKDDICLYITPRYSYSSLNFFDQTNDSLNGTSEYLSYGAFSYGLIIGKKNKLMIEVTHSQNNGFKPTQVAIGFSSTFDMKNKKWYKRYFGE